MGRYEVYKKSKVLQPLKSHLLALSTSLVKPENIDEQGRIHASHSILNISELRKKDAKMTYIPSRNLP